MALQRSRVQVSLGPPGRMLETVYGCSETLNRKHAGRLIIRRRQVILSWETRVGKLEYYNLIRLPYQSLQYTDRAVVAYVSPHYGVVSKRPKQRGLDIVGSNPTDSTNDTQRGGWGKKSA